VRTSYHLIVIVNTKANALSLQNWPAYKTIEYKTGQHALTLQI